MKITIATPMYGGQCTGVFAKSLAISISILQKAGIAVEFLDLYNESLITRARNTLTHMFLQGDSDYLLFIDADQSFRGEDIIRMVKHDKDIIAAPVPMKSFNWNAIRKAALNNKTDLSQHSGLFNVNFLPGFIESNAKFNLSEPVEVLYAGSGMILIKRGVFERLSESVANYVYDGYPIPQYNLIPGKAEMKDYWNTAIVNNRLLSEDYNFCSMWKNTGGKIYVDLLAKVVHVGTHVFAGNIIDPEILEASKQPEKETTKPKSKKAKA